MSALRAVALAVALIVGLFGSTLATSARAEAHAQGQQHIQAIRNPAKPPRNQQPSAGPAVVTPTFSLMRPAAALVHRVHTAWLQHRIATTRNRILASLAQDPDNFDERDALWQRLHRLQSRRDIV